MKQSIYLFYTTLTMTSLIFGAAVNRYKNGCYTWFGAVAGSALGVYQRDLRTSVVGGLLAAGAVKITLTAVELRKQSQAEAKLKRLREIELNHTLGVRRDTVLARGGAASSLSSQGDADPKGKSKRRVRFASTSGAGASSSSGQGNDEGEHMAKLKHKYMIDRLTWAEIMFSVDRGRPMVSTNDCLSGTTPWKEGRVAQTVEKRKISINEHKVAAYYATLAEALGALGYFSCAALTWKLPLK